MSTFCCRCGWRDEPESGPHPCHACRERPGTRRLIALGPAALPGHTMKYSAYETWGCDECWELYQRTVTAKGKHDK